MSNYIRNFKQDLWLYNFSFGCCHLLGYSAEYSVCELTFRRKYQLAATGKAAGFLLGRILPWMCGLYVLPKRQFM
jgi:hypothetical protein